MIQITNLEKSFSGSTLFEGLTFSLTSKERMGLVGRNGTGKSTLLKIIADLEIYDAGGVIKPKDYKVGLLDQHLNFSAQNVLDECMIDLPSEMQEQFYLAEKILMGLGFKEEDFRKNINDFSGGYQIRIHLTKLLLQEPNLLLLDEPTNYLDIVSLRWLARFLKSYPGEVILITHDRNFMDNVVTTVGGIFKKKFRKVKGKSKKLYELLEEEREHLLNTRENQLKRRKQMQDFVDKYRAKARKASQAQSKLKQIEKMDIASVDDTDNIFNFSFRYKETPAKQLLEVKNIKFGYTPKNVLINDLSFYLKPGEIIGIIGANGKGKSTLMNLISGELEALEGVMRLHPGSKIAHFGQTNVSRLDEAATIYEEVQAANPDMSLTEVRSICGAMLFTEDDAYKKIGVLSGGERSRVLLGKILAQSCNILLLDEPSNHLDMESVEVFCEEVKKFKGGTIIVSHDEGILDKVCDKLLVFKDDESFEFLGNYKDFLERVGWDEEIEVEKSYKTKKQVEKVHPKKAKNTVELNKLEVELEKLEQKISDLEKLDAEYEKKITELSQKGDLKKLQEFTPIWDNIKDAIEESYNAYNNLLEAKES